MPAAVGRALTHPRENPVYAADPQGILCAERGRDAGFRALLSSRGTTSMNTEYKLGAAAVGIIVLIGTSVWFANQPKNEKTGLPFDKSTASGAKTAADKTVSAAPGGAGAKPTAPPIPQAKLNTSPPAPGSGTKIESPVSASPKTETTLPPVVATAPPARRSTDSIGDTSLKVADPAVPSGGSTSPASGTGSTTPGSATPGSHTPGLAPPGGNAPTVSTPTTGEPARPTIPPARGNPSPGVTTPPAGGSTANPASSAPPKTESPKPANSGRPTVYDTEIERAPTAVGDLSGRSSSPSRQTPSDPRFGPSSNSDKPLTPTGRNTEPARKPASDAKPVSGQSYTIQHGDRLSTIAREKYGDASYLKLIKEANPGLNENKIYAGTTIILPDREGSGGANAKPELTAKRDRDGKLDSANPAAAGRPGAKPETAANPAGAGKPTAGNAKTDGSVKANTDAAKPENAAKDQTGNAASSYTVRRGDSLRKIAKAKLNDENRWREIHALNKDQLASGDALEIGMTLRMPPADKPADANKPRGRSR